MVKYENNRIFVSQACKTCDIRDVNLRIPRTTKPPILLNSISGSNLKGRIGAVFAYQKGCGLSVIPN